MSLEQYNVLTKAVRNAEYLSKIDRAFDQIEANQGKQHDLIEVEDNE